MLKSTMKGTDRNGNRQEGKRSEDRPNASNGMNVALFIAAVNAETR